MNQKKYSESPIGGRSITDYFSLNSIMTFLFSLAGIIVTGQILSAVAMSGGFQNEFARSLLFNSSVSYWFVSIVFAFTALLSRAGGKAAYTKRDENTWNVMTAFFLLLSCHEVARVGDVLGWANFLIVPASVPFWVVSAVLMIPFLFLGFRLKSALADSSNSARCFVLGGFLYLGSSLGEVFVYANPNLTISSTILSLMAVLHMTIRMLAAIILMAGAGIHEEYLHATRRRLMSGYTPGGIPRVKTENAAWAMRMIGTPTRDEMLMEEEVRKAKARAKSRQK